MRKKKTQDSILAYIKLSYWYMWLALKRMWEYFCNFLGPVADSVYGKINLKEFYRTVQLAGGVGGGIWGFLAYLGDNCTSIIQNDTFCFFFKMITHPGKNTFYIAVCEFILVLLLDLLRRRTHSAEELAASTPKKIISPKRIIR
jgi:hypothetical protein